MRWILIERRPDVVYCARGQETYLGKDGTAVKDVALAMTFATREAAEAHRRTLKHRYNWVSVSAAR
jgi:hypothetical protein